ncbi:MAG: NUDIX domain-containing protein [Rikenellaceae bacterium]
MKKEIYFTTHRLTISSEPSNGFRLSPDPDCGVQRSRLSDLFHSHHAVSVRTTDDAHTEEVYHRFAQQYTEVLAAGGVVERSDGRILMIYRNGRWDLPKGHWEEGESIEECAVREVEEESGVGGITLGRKLCETTHAYYLRGKWELKTTHWYAMHSDDDSPLTPQVEEGIERAEWIEAEDVEEISKGSFPTIKDVLSAFYPNK